MNWTPKQALQYMLLTHPASPVVCQLTKLAPSVSISAAAMAAANLFFGIVNPAVTTGTPEWTDLFNTFNDPRVARPVPGGFLVTTDPKILGTVMSPMYDPINGCPAAAMVAAIYQQVL